jgi:hypothetical protein
MFVGSYTGTIDVTTVQGTPTTVTQTWTLTQTGDTVDLTNFSSCPGINGTASGSVATINMISCPIQSGVTTTYTGGTLTIQGNSLVLNMTFDLNGNGISTTGTLTGTLTKGGGSAQPGGPGCETSGTFTMTQPCNSPSSTMSLDVTMSGSHVTIQRSPVSGDTDSCTYLGTMSADCGSASGTFVCVGAGGGSGTWSATISGQCASGGGCGLGTSWAEQEAYPGTSGNCSSFVLQ